MLIFDTNIFIEGQTSPLFDLQPARIGFRLKQHLKSVGWVHQASGDGLAAFSTTPGNAFDVITSELDGAGGMANDLAWFILKHPGSARQLAFQASAQYPSFTYWRIKYSRLSGFNGGTPGPVEMPSAADGKFCLGGGTDASPIFGQWMNPTPDGAYLQIAADNAAPYGFWAGAYGIVGSAYNYNPTIMSAAVDPLVNTAVGDPDPYAFYFSKNNAYGSWRGDLAYMYDISGFYSGSVSAWSDIGGPNEFWGSWEGTTLSPFRTSSTGQRAFNPHNNKIDRSPMYYMRNLLWKDGSANLPGYKGRSTLMTYISQDFPAGQTLKSVTARDTIVIGFVALPWNGTLPKV